MNKEVFLQKAQEYIGFEQDPFLEIRLLNWLKKKILQN